MDLPRPPVEVYPYQLTYGFTKTTSRGLYNQETYGFTKTTSRGLPI